MELRRVFLPIVLLLGAAPWIPASATSPPAAATSTTAPPLATLQQQAATGDAAAEVTLGQRLMQSEDPVDKTQAVSWFRKAAAQGNTDAEWLLGSAYFGGTGVTRDRSTGMDWMRKSLPGGPADHMWAYGMMDMMYGAGFADGAKWIQRSAEAGSTKGMVFWAMLEFHGGQSGVVQNKADAERWLRKSASLGNLDAQTMLGQFDIRGAFGTPDVDAGLQWLTKAANQGSSRAQGLLGAFLISGEAHVPKNPAAGVRWAQKAAAKHNVYGYYALGLAYQQGLGGEPADPAKAWYNFAAAQRLDVKHALDHVAVHLSEVGGKLSAEQLDELQTEVSKIPLPKKNDQT